MILALSHLLSLPHTHILQVAALKVCSVFGQSTCVSPPAKEKVTLLFLHCLVLDLKEVVLVDEPASFKCMYNSLFCFCACTVAREQSADQVTALEQLEIDDVALQTTLDVVDVLSQQLAPSFKILLIAFFAQSVAAVQVPIPTPVSHLSQIVIVAIILITVSALFPSPHHPCLCLLLFR